MKKALKTITIILGIFFSVAIIIIGCIIYEIRYEKDVVDTAQSADGKYELILQQVGTPEFPFGPTSGQLVLKCGKKTIIKEDFEIADDGKHMHDDNWSIDWHDKYVKVTLFGEEQNDELVILYYDGRVKRLSLTTKYGIEESTTNYYAEHTTEANHDLKDDSPLSGNENLPKIN